MQNLFVANKQICLSLLLFAAQITASVIFAFFLNNSELIQV